MRQAKLVNHRPRQRRRGSYDGFALLPHEEQLTAIVARLRRCLRQFLAAWNELGAGGLERFREAGRLGLRDRRLGLLIGLSLFKAGQKLLYADSPGG